MADRWTSPRQLVPQHRRLATGAEPEAAEDAGVRQHASVQEGVFANAGALAMGIVPDFGVSS